MRTRPWAIAAALVVAGCGGGGATEAGGDQPAPTPTIEVVVDDEVPAIVRITGVTCRRVDDTQLVASGVVASSGDDSHYVNLQIRFVDADGVRVELATDSVSDLRVGESARWDATTYADGAPDVRRCEVTATVS